jgi:hypothetical protein
MPGIGLIEYSGTTVNFIGSSGDHRGPTAVNSNGVLQLGEMIAQQHVNEAIPAADPLNHSAPCRGVQEPDKPQWKDSAGPEHEPQHEVLVARGAGHEPGEDPEHDPRSHRKMQPIAGTW